MSGLASQSIRNSRYTATVDHQGTRALVMADPFRLLFDSLADKRIPGGCSTCDAEQRLEEVAPNVWSLVVCHDDRCPVLRAHKAVTN